MRRTFMYFAAFTGMGTLFAATMLAAALVTGATDPRGGGTETTPSAAPADNEILGTIEIHAFDLGFRPSEVTVDAPGRYAVSFVNDGGAFHDITFADGTKLEANARETATGEVVVPAGGLAFICSVPGHADGGMKGEVVVGGDGHGGHQPAEPRTAEEMRDIDAARTAMFPAETEGRGNQVLEPEVLDDGTLQWEITASVIEWETEPDVRVEAYAYNGMVPGPQLHAQLGDRVRIILHNELPEPTTIHFHGLIVPNNMDGVAVINQDAVMPGESFTYEFELRNAGSHMYHSHFMAEHQVPMGLLGAFVVTDPEDPYTDVALDYPMIVNDGPLGYTINGKGFPATEPLVTSLGDRIRIRYMNEGLQIHPMHLHGIPQLVIAKDGYLLPAPHYEDTVLVAPGERVDVIVDATELGVWAFHCHILTHAESLDGMFGMVTALIVEE